MRRITILAAATGLFGVAQAAVAQDHLYGLTLRFDPAALERLTDMGERVVIAAWYHGDPVNPAVPVDEIGQVFLGSEEAEIWPADQMVWLGGTLSAAVLAQVTEARVNINVFTARRMHDDNLLDCGLTEGPVADLQAQTPAMLCKLITP